MWKLTRHFPFKLWLWGVQVGIFTSFLLFNLTWFNFAWNNHNKTGYFVWSICLLGSLRQTTWNGSRVERKIKILKTACLKPLLRSKFSKLTWRFVRLPASHHLGGVLVERKIKTSNSKKNGLPFILSCYSLSFLFSWIFIIEKLLVR
mgnify:CR=1 FL=1